MMKCKYTFRSHSLVLKMACSASFFSRNSVFLSQQFSRNSIFQLVSAKFQTRELHVCQPGADLARKKNRLVSPSSSVLLNLNGNFCYDAYVLRQYLYKAIDAIEHQWLYCRSALLLALSFATTRSSYQRWLLDSGLEFTILRLLWQLGGTNPGKQTEGEGFYWTC